MSGRIRAESEGGGPGGGPPPIEEPVSPPPQNDNPPAAPPPSDPPEPEPEEAAREREQREHKERFDRLTREKYEAQRQRDEYAQALQQMRQMQANTNRPPNGNDNPSQWQQPQDPREMGRQQGLQEAREAEVARRFNDDCNTLFRRGQDEFGDMSDAVAALNAVGYGTRPDALMALTQLPDGHRVYRELAGNLDNAARILQMPPMQMAVELARMSRGADAADAPPPAAAVPVSRAPAPLRRVGGNSGQAERPLSDPNVPMAEWIRRRDREERRSRIMR